MILVNISEVHQATSHPPVTQDQVGVLSGGTKLDMKGIYPFTVLSSFYRNCSKTWSCINRLLGCLRLLQSDPVLASGCWDKALHRAAPKWLQKASDGVLGTTTCTKCSGIDQVRWALSHCLHWPNSDATSKAIYWCRLRFVKIVVHCLYTLTFPACFITECLRTILYLAERDGEM